MEKFQVAIIGGGLAGLTAAIHLSREGLKVVLFEKNNYPVHKVCGEYISNEVLPYLNRLGIDLKKLNPTKIKRLLFSTRSGKTMEKSLPQGGMGISRYCLDGFLYQKAVENGVEIINSTVESCEFHANSFSIKTIDESSHEAEIVIGAFGKRSNLDKKLNRKFIQNKSTWLAVKMHYENDQFPDDLVALHNFEGGYCGLSKTENGAVNFCYLASYKNFKTHKNIAVFNQEVVAKNQHLMEFMKHSKPLFEKPLSIAQVSFQPKKCVNQHILMTGDAAGLIHPLCGNGMAMAIHSAKLASESILIYFKFENRNRHWLENNYREKWNTTFKKRLFFGNKLQSLLLNPTLSDAGVSLFSKNEGVLNTIIKQTHGKPF